MDVLQAFKEADDVQLDSNISFPASEEARTLLVESLPEASSSSSANEGL